MMRVLESRAESRECFEALVATCRSSADTAAMHRASFRPGSVEKETFFFQGSDFWIMPTDGSGHSKSATRYWNCFGLGGSPKTASSRIVIEINHPHEGRNRRLTGRFLRDERGFLLGHVGRLGGGRGDGSAHAFEKLPAAQTMERAVVDDEVLYLVARIEPGAQFVRDVGAFVRAMAVARYSSDAR